MAYRVKELTDEACEAWDRFVEAAPGATFFHRSGWRRVLADSFGHRPCYRYVENDGDIAGVLPMAHVNSRLFGNRLASLPFCVAGSPVGDSSEVDDLLDGEAIRLMEELGARYVEYRDTARSRAGWAEQSDLYASFAGEMEPAEDRRLSRIPRKQRAVLRKALGAPGLTWTIDADTQDLYGLYALSVRNLGTPVFPRRYFRALAQEFGGSCEILTVRLHGKPVSSVLSFYFRDRVMPYYTGSRPEARGVGANDLMYWLVMGRAVERGCRVFDFGRSKIDTGPWHFKKNWGFEPRPVAHQYWLRNGQEIPQVNPTNRRYRAFIALWRHLPLPVANTLGPYLVRGAG